MPIFLNESASVLFVHIPKCAGTSVSNIFRKNYKRYFVDAGLGDRNFFKLRKCSPQHYHRDILQLILKVEDFDHVFHVIRNPVTRIVSEYVMRSNSSSGEGFLSFEDFCRNVFSRYKSNPYVLDNHIRPQVEFILPEGEIYYYEDGVRSVYENLSEKVGGLTYRNDPSFYVSHRGVGKITPSDVEITDNALEEIFNFYRDDIFEFGYSF